MSRVEIQHEDIKRGDLVRVENGLRREGVASSIEYVASYDGFNWYEDSGYGHTYYLLDRPTPAVKLPSKPCLGFASWTAGPGFMVFIPGSGDCVLGQWVRGDDAVFCFKPLRSTLGSVRRARITAFTEATTVPTEALDLLRRSSLSDSQTQWHALQSFLAAVDNASTR